MCPAFHLARPPQEAPEFAAFAPHKFPELQKTDLLHLYTGISLDAPEKIWASPGSQSMSPGSIPQEADLVAHVFIINTKKALSNALAAEL
jgi:hypothetical protein